MLNRTFKKWLHAAALILVLLAAACRPPNSEEVGLPTANITAVKTASSPSQLTGRITSAARASSGPGSRSEPSPAITVTKTEVTFYPTAEELLHSYHEIPIPEAEDSQADSSAQPIIKNFSASSDRANPGDTIRLEWTAQEPRAMTLWRLAPTGQFSHFWPVEREGYLEYEIDIRERNWINFTLSAEGFDGRIETATLTVVLNCTAEWFILNPPDICPLDPPLQSEAAEQHFQRGTMIWVNDEGRIYVLFDDGRTPRWNAYDDEWDGGSVKDGPPLTSPSDLYAPVRGFGHLWTNQPDVRERLGWAVDKEVGFVTILQRTSYAKYNETFIASQDGFVWHLFAEKSDWVKE